MRVATHFIIAAALAAVLAGCGGSSADVPVRSNFVEFSEDQLAEIETGSGNEYRIQADDVIRVAFAHHKELSQDPVLVLPDGAVSLVGVDRVVVAGMTLTQADSVITGAYSKEYREPQISVIVLESSGRMVYVLGEGRNPGLIKLPRGGLGIVGAVARAGGFTEDAAKQGSVLVRVTDTGYLVQEIDLSRFHEPEGIALAMVDLQPFDVVYVPRSRLGDFGYFSKTVLVGLLNITRIAADIKYLSDPRAGRY